MPFSTAGALPAAASLIGGVTSAIGASSAADDSSRAANYATNIQAGQLAFNNKNQGVYDSNGKTASNQLASLNTGNFGLGNSTNYLQQASNIANSEGLNVAATPATMTQAQLEATPGYQFNLSQGLQATQNAAAARGLGVSGAALKGAATYATGLADSTYQNQFANEQTQYSDQSQNIQNLFSNAQALFGNQLSLNQAQQGNVTNQYNRLLGQASLGENAAAQTGSTGATISNALGNAAIASGNAQAAGAVGSSNALSSGLTNAANTSTSNALLQQLITNQNGGASGGIYGSNTGTGDGQGNSSNGYNGLNYGVMSLTGSSPN